MTSRYLVLILLLFILISCSPRQASLGFEPPVTSDPLQTWTENWSRLELFSGAFDANYLFSDGDDQSVRADLLIKPDLGSVVSLSYQGSAVAHVMISDDVINLLNHREKYYLIEDATVDNCRSMIGIPLLSKEIAAIFSGRGFLPDRYSQVLPSSRQEGGVTVSLWHASENIRATAWIDAKARLRSITFTTTDTEIAFLRAEYLEFRHDTTNNVVWPNLIRIHLLDRNERLELWGRSVDINNQRLLKTAQRQFVHRVRGAQILLADIPPGPPVLYRNIKIYSQEDDDSN